MDIFVISFVNLPKFEVLNFVVILHKYFYIYHCVFDFIRYENKNGFHNISTACKRICKEIRPFIYYNSIRVSNQNANRCALQL